MWADRSDVAFGELENKATASSITLGSRKGVVGRKCTNRSGCTFSCSESQFKACSKNSLSVDVSVADSAGRINGTSAP